MESPLEVQKSLYGEDGPPMIFLPEASALDLEVRAPPPSKRARISCAAKEGRKINTHGEPKVVSAREIFAKVKASQAFYSSIIIKDSKSNSNNSSSQLPCPCQLPGDFPPELAFRSLAAYSLLRTLSIQLRLSPFTPNVFLRALHLPAPNRLLGEIHVALLRILFVQKLKNMGYSYKPGGGGVGVTKRRQIDNIRWPLLAGDNLTHLDAHSWPLFYDDYCHLTADRLWASYHGSLDGDGEDGNDTHNFIDFRNIGIFVPPKGEEYQTKQHADGVTVQVPITISSGNATAAATGFQGTDTKRKFDERIHNETNTKKETAPLHIPSSAIKSDSAGLAEATMLNSDESDSEEEYQDGEDDAEAWEKPKRKKRRRKGSKTASSTLSSKKQKNKSASGAWSRITSLESSTSTPIAIATPTLKVSKDQSVPSDPSWSRVASIETSFSSPPQWSPRQQSIQYSQAQSQSQPQSSILSSVATLNSVPPKKEMNESSQPKQGNDSQSQSQPQPDILPSVAASNCVPLNNEMMNESSQPTQSEDSQSQSQPQPGILSSVAASNDVPPSKEINESSQPTQSDEGNNLPSETTMNSTTSGDAFERKSSKTISTESTLPSALNSDDLVDSMKAKPLDAGIDEKDSKLPVQMSEDTKLLSKPDTTKSEVGSEPFISSTDPSLSISSNSNASNHFSNESDSGEKIETNPHQSSVLQSTAHSGSSTTSDKSQYAMPLASTGIQDNLIGKSPQEDQGEKSIQTDSDTQPSEQHQLQANVRSEEETSKDVDMTSSNDPARIRGGGFVNDTNFVVPSNSGSSRQSMGRPRGSRRALPTRNTNGPSATAGYSAHAQHVSMLQLQQQRQQQQYLLYQSQIHQNYGASPGITMYPPYKTNSRANSRQFQYQAAYNIAPNEKLQSERGTRNSFEDHAQESDTPFVVPDKIAEILNGVVNSSSTHKWKVEDIEGTDHKHDDDDDDSVYVDDKFEKELEMERWLHFKPLEAMRSGLPYHRLPTEDKVCILEFLMDELLTVDAISAEFTKRHNQTCYHESPYGTLPTEDEYQNLENHDECVVCGQEGDLLCCDGCLSSYHSYCLGMKVGEELPEGKWLCPECSLVDPCNYGSLQGGCKSSLDWFALEDIKSTSNIGNQNNTTGSMVSPYSSLTWSSKALPSQNLSAIHNPTTDMGSSSNDPCSASDGEALVKASTQSGTTGNLLKWKERQFIVVHGFVFSRESSEPKSAFEALKSPKPCLALTKSELEGFISQIDDNVSKAWPLAQIPSTKTPCSWKFPSVKDYFSRNESNNPFLYESKYLGAPVSYLMKVGAANTMVKLMYLTYERQCNESNTSQISEVLTEDFTFDAEIATCLKTQTTLFDPFQVLKGYMFKLEHALRRSCMLNEFWEGGQFKSRSEIWMAKVRRAKSIRGLSRLLLKLVNSMHTKAFERIWFHSHISKSSDSDTATSERNYKALPTDWSEEKEKLKRKWETTPSKMILSLCSDNDNDLVGFASKIRSDIFIPKQINIKKSKRKLRKAALAKSKMLKKNEDIIGAKTQELAGTNKLEDSMTPEPIPTNREEQYLSANPSNIANKKLEVGQLPPDSANDPAATKAMEGPEIGIEKLQHTNPNQVETFESKSAIVGAPYPVNAQSVDKGNVTEASPFEKISENSGQEKDNQVLQGPDSCSEPTESAQGSGVATKSKIEQENTSKPVENCDGNAEKMEDIIVSNTVEGNTTAESHAPDSSKKKTSDGNAEKIEDIIVSNTVEGNTTMESHPPDSSKKEKSDDNAETMDGTIVSNTVEGNATTESHPSNSSKKKKRKKPKKSSTGEPLTRRRTRHSGRLSADHIVESSTAKNPSELRESIELDMLEGMALQIENAKKQKIPGLEKLLKGQYAVEGIWPIAGRRVFPTVGNIPPKEMKRIARNAGSTVAANLSYHTNHEVAQVCYGHIWRKRVERCNRFEELLYLMRILESSLDRETIQQCESQTRRGKNSLQKVIRCTIRNPSSGSLDHFLVNKKSRKGCWIPGEQLDLSSLILDLFCRRQSQKEQRLVRVRAKERAEREMMERERSRRMAESAQKAREEKIRKEEARRLAKLKKHEDAAKKKLEQEAKKNARMMATMLSQQQKQNSALTAEIDKWTKQRDLVFTTHEIQVQLALRSWADRGYTNIPENNIIEIRKRTVEKLSVVMDRLQRCNGPVMHSQEILSRMFLLEKNAASKVQMKKDGVGTMGRSPQSMNANNNSFSRAGTAAFESNSSSSQPAISNTFAHGGHQKLFSTTNTTPNVPSTHGSTTTIDQNRQQQLFGNGNTSQVTISNQQNLGQNIMSPEPIKNQMQSPFNDSPLPLNGSRNYFDAKREEFGLQSNSGGSQKFAGNFQNKAQAQNATTQYYSTPDLKKNPFIGASSGGNDNMFKNADQYKQQANSLSQPYSNSRSLSPMQQAQQSISQSQMASIQQQQQQKYSTPMQQAQQPINQSQRTSIQQQQQQQNYTTPMHQTQQPMRHPQRTSVQQQQQQKYSGFPNQQDFQTHDRRFGKATNVGSTNNSHLSRTSGPQQRDSNTLLDQQNSMRYNHKQQLGMNHQHYASSTASTGQNFNSSNRNHHGANGSVSNVWNNQNSMASEYNTSGQQNQSPFSGHGGIYQQQQQHQQQQQNQFSINGSDYSRQSTNTNTTRGMSSLPGNYGKSNPNQMNSGSELHGMSHQPFHTGYGQPQGVMNQKATNVFPNQPQQQRGFEHSNYAYSTNEQNQNRHQPMSMAPAQQQQHHQGLPPTGFQNQQQYSQSQRNQQQQQQNQLESIQKQIYMLKQQQRQQQQNMQQHGQFNGGSNGNNYYG